MEWWFVKVHSYIVSSKAEPLNLIQIFLLLQLAPVTFRPTHSLQTKNCSVSVAPSEW